MKIDPEFVDKVAKAISLRVSTVDDVELMPDIWKLYREHAEAAIKVVHEFRMRMARNGINRRKKSEAK
jgi:hypothetical protein